MGLNQMDRIDRDVLRELRKNPTKPFLRIAKEIGIASLTVQKRYEKMKKAGIIFGPYSIIDLSKIGYQGKAFLLITNNQICDSDVTVEAINAIPNVFLTSEIMGTFDMLAMVAFKDIAEIKEIVDEIRAIPCVQQVEVELTNNTIYPIKQEYKNMRIFGPETAESS